MPFVFLFVPSGLVVSPSGVVGGDPTGTDSGRVTPVYTGPLLVPGVLG